MPRYSNILAGLALMTLACATKGSAPDPAISGAQRGSRDFIGTEEIERAGGGNALDFIRKVRPMWLVKRGPQSIQNESDVIVYMGTARMGGLQALKEIPLSSLTSLRYLDVAAANYRFGAGHPYGAIVVSMSQ
jgi:hypothetical protein